MDNVTISVGLLENNLLFMLPLLRKLPKKKNISL